MLPDTASQSAVNARLFTGDLTAWRQFAQTKGFANTGPVRTVFLLNDKWLSWDEDVDVARGTVPGDDTFRTYLTGLDVPRWTNYALATTGAEPFPVVTRPLGVPAPDAVPTLAVGIDPTPTTFSVDVFDPGDELAASWTVSPTRSASNYASRVLQSSYLGDQAYKIEIENNNGSAAYAYRNFGISGSSVSRMSTDFIIATDQGGDGIAIEIALANSSTGAGVRAGIFGDIDSPALTILVGSDWETRSTLSSVGLAGLTRGVRYTLTAQRVVNADNTVSFTVGLYAGSGQLGTLVAVGVFTDGDFCALIGITGNDEKDTFYDNISVQATGSLGVTITNIATSYVYTFVNDIAEQSAPSLPSATVLRPDGVSVTVTTPTTIPSGVGTSYGITTKRIYRAVTGSSGTAFRFVAEIPLAQADYVDVLADTELGEVLPSDLWALPPDDLRGILALPNGVMVGFRRNQLCFSAQNQPHAWPVEYRLNTDTDIVGIGNIDTTVVIGTKSFVYVASGNDPANYSMAKFEVPQAASSKRSFTYITGLGVVCSSPDGLLAIAGVGQIRNLTQEVFTREQWQALDPTSIVSVAHNDIYFMFWETGSNRGCYAVDLRSGGFGVVEMAFHACAAYVDPIEDKMYLVLDANFEPDDLELPVPPSILTYVDGVTLFEFDGNPTERMVFDWWSKLYLLEYPGWRQIAQVRATTYDNLIVRFYGDGVLLDTIVITEETEFTLSEPPDGEPYSTFQMRITGTDPVRVLQAADDVTELA